MLYELCTLLLVILRPLGQVAEAGVASMQLGVSMELMLCGLLTFMLGFFLMPWVLDLACVFLFVGFVTNLSGIGRAILCWPAVCEVLSHKEASTCLGGFGAKSNSPVHHQGKCACLLYCYHTCPFLNCLKYASCRIPVLKNCSIQVFVLSLHHIILYGIQ
ncbi:uncharacterized protein LOC124652024 isoform X3 [Lolium rigidum]|nr:uncharacterized protein LOC124652024 isoform X3 [Lolium rigidum]